MTTTRSTNYEIEFHAPDGDSATIDEDMVEGVDIVRAHTALSDWKATVPFSPKSIKDWLTSTVEAHILFGGDLVFRGYLERADSDQQGHQTVIEGRGIGRDLLDIDAQHHADDIDAHDAIADIWAMTPFDATVHPSDGGADRINDRMYEDDALTVLQKLHDRAGYRFSIDMEADTRTVESFEHGSIEREATYIVKNRQPVRDLYDYANRVVVFGASDDAGERPRAEAVSEAEIELLGGDPDNWAVDDPEVRTRVLRRPDLETVNDAESEAESQLRDFIRERDDSGTLEIQPQNVAPGYNYPVDWYNDGTVDSTRNESVKFNESYQSAGGGLEFDRNRGVSVSIVESKRTAATIADAL